MIPYWEKVGKQKFEHSTTSDSEMKKKRNKKMIVLFFILSIYCYPKQKGRI